MGTKRAVLVEVGDGIGLNLKKGGHRQNRWSLHKVRGLETLCKLCSEQKMKLEKLYKVGSELKLNSWPDSSDV